MNHSATSIRRPAPTRCPHCGHSNGGRFTVCPICKADLMVGIASGICGVAYLFLTIGGYA